MATEMVPIRSIKQYVREFGYEGIVKEHLSRDLVKHQVLDAFEKEVFGQIVFRYKDASLLSRPDEEVDDKTREGVRHILSNAKWKWKRLCQEFDKYKETRNLIYPDELMMEMQDIVRIQESERENPGEIPMDNRPVEVETVEKEEVKENESAE